MISLALNILAFLFIAYLLIGLISFFNPPKTRAERLEAMDKAARMRAEKHAKRFTNGRTFF